MADEQISAVCSITGLPLATAQQILQAANGNVEEAIRLYYESQEGEQEEADSEMAGDDEPQSSNSAGASQPDPPAGSSRPPQNQSRMRTLRDIQGGGGGGDDSDDEDENKQDFFAGGEKSGLAVQNPNNADHFSSILNQARQNRPRPGGEDEATPQTNFTGRAQTLGGDDAPSQVINEGQSESASRASRPRVTRTLHLWQDGFSVDDGPLYRFDDPANASTLALINQGRAPLTLLGVEPGQEVDLQLIPHKDEKYVQPKQKYKPFGGQGQRLGSPTPGPSGAGETAPIAHSTPSRASTAVSSSTAAPTMTVDDSQPVVTLQIRLGNGSRLSSRFNTSHTIGDVYDFVNRSNPESAGRSWALMTTFPTKELTDKAAKLGDLSDFKRGGTVVQKWT